MGFLLQMKRTFENRNQYEMFSGVIERLFVFFLSCALLFPSVASGSEAQKCVEDQVSHFKTVGSKTILPNRYAKSHGVKLIADLPGALSERGLTVICFDMGQSDAKLRELWPSQRLDIRVHAVFKHEEASVSELSRLVRRSVDHVERFVGTKAPLTVDIFIGSSLRSVSQTMDQTLGASDSLASIERAWSRRCANSQKPGAFAKAKLIVLCIPSENELSVSIQQYQDTIIELLAHEYFHSIQLQISGAFSAIEYEKYPVFGSPGPDWLLEGSAQYIGLLERFSAQEIYSAFLADVDRLGYSDKEQCDRLIEQQARFDPMRGKRAISIIAVTKLINDTSWQRLVEFYADIGMSFDWKQSYRKVFETNSINPMGC